MKRKFKRIASLVLAAVMVFAMAVPAMAEDGPLTDEPLTKVGPTATVKFDGGHYLGHTYDVYQIFTADIATQKLADGSTKEVLSNVKYGNSGYGTKDAPVDETTLKAIEDANTFAKDNLSSFTIPYATLPTDKVGDGADDYVLENVPVGYYVIVDRSDGDKLGDSDAVSAYVVEVVQGTVTITPKADVPKLEKKVQEKNDSTNTTTDWQDAADYDIGDAVPFQLTATLPDDEKDFAKYDTYKLVFHDDMSKGLTFKEDSVVVKVNGTEIPKEQFAENGITVTTEGLTDGCEFEVTIVDVKKLAKVVAGSTITVEFKATLNDGAVIGGTGNPNEAKLEYSNNPNSTEQTGETPKDKVVVFTFDVDVNKVQPDPENPEETIPLEGAEFTLYKWIKGETPEDEEADKAGKYDPPTGEEVGYWQEVEVINHTTDKRTEFVFNGEDSGIYKLVETVTPPGFNTAAPIDFTISATYDTEADKPELKTLTVTPPEANFTATIADGLVKTDVVNREGATLPETGGIGTTIFYVVGSVLVLGAVILLVTKRRMKAD